MHTQSPALSRSQTVAPLLVFLLAIRLLFLGGIRFVTWPQYPQWLLPIFEVATYALTALLFYTCRHRLSHYHVTSLALAIFILAPFAAPVGFWLADLLILPTDWLVFASQAIMGCAFAIALFQKDAGALSLGRDRPFPLLLSAAVGIGLGLIFGLYFVVTRFSGMSIYRQAAQLPGGISSFIGLAIIQLHGAAVPEEPLFRGLGWGGLRDLGLNDPPTLLVQALLFTVSHMYYLRFAPFSMWVIVPIVGLVLGLFAWRTRSIATTMIAHALINAVAIAFGRV